MAFPWLIAAAAGANIASNWLSNEQNASLSREQMRWQSGENQLNRNHDYDMSWLQLAMNPVYLKQQSTAEYDLWKKEFDAQNAYNSPSAQVARDLAAGVSPLSGQMMTNGNNQMAAQGSIPAMPSYGGHLGGSASPVGLPYQPVIDLADVLTAVGQYKRDISQSKKSDKEVERYDELVDSQIESYIQKAASDEKLAEYTDLQKCILQAFGFSKAAQDVLKTTQEAYAAQTQGDLNKSLELLNKSQKNLNDDEHAKNKPFVDKANEVYEIWRKQQYAEIRERFAKAYEASTQGKLNITVGQYYEAITQTENTLRDGRVTAQELANDLSTIAKYIQGNELKFSDRTLENRIEMVTEGLKQQKLISDQQYEILQQQKIKTKWADRMEWMNYWTGFFNSAANVIGSASGYYSGSINRMNQVDRNRIQQDFNDIIREKYAPNDVKHVSGFGYTPDWQK